MSIPLDVRIAGSDAPVPVTRRVFRTPITTIPGVVPSVAYASGDAVGTKFTLEVPIRGTIDQAILIDQDKEQILLCLYLFNGDFDGGTDNSAFDMTDGNATRLLAVIPMGMFYATSDNAVGFVSDLGIVYLAPQGLLYIQAVTRGVPNLTAATDYAVGLVIRE